MLTSPKRLYEKYGGGTGNVDCVHWQMLISFLLLKTNLGMITNEESPLNS